MNKKLALILGCVMCLLLNSSFAQNNPITADTLRNNLSTRTKLDSNNREWILIDTTTIETKDTFRKLVLSRHKDSKYNFADSTIKLDTRKFINRNQVKLRKGPEHWIVYVFIIISLLYVIIRNAYSKTLPVVFQAYWNDRAISQFTRDDNFFKPRSLGLYFLLFVSVYGLFIKLILNNFELHIANNALMEYINIALFVTVYYVAKFMLMKLSAYLFSIHKLISGYLSVISISNFIYAIFLIPMLVLHHYLPENYANGVFFIIMIAFFFNTVYKYLRTASFILNNFQFPKFYLFLYLCTLEIMPLLIIYKVVLA